MADELDIVLHDVDEIDIDASFSDEIEITLSEVDDVEIMLFDYPADIDLLTSRVKACEDSSTTAVDMAEQAVVASSEAVNSVASHLQQSQNPHPTNITQEFSEIKVSMLKDETSGGGIDDAQWAWLNIPPAEKTSVFSVLRAMLAKIYASLLFYAPIPAKEFAGEIALDKDYTPYNSWTPTTSITLTVAQGSRVGGTADGIMVLTNVNLSPSLANLTVWPLSQDIDSTGTWSWMAWRNSSGTFISFTKIA